MISHSRNIYRPSMYLLGTDGLTALAQAIQTFEGGHPNDRNMRNNNPGNIEYGNFATAHGAIHGDPRFAVFPDYNTGFDALKSLIQRYASQGDTVMQMMNHYAPPSENNTALYAQTIANQVGATVNTLLSDIIGTNTEAHQGFPSAGGESSVDLTTDNTSIDTTSADSGTFDYTNLYWIGGAALAAYLFFFND